MVLQPARLLLLSVMLFVLPPASVQVNQGVRLEYSPLGEHAGRVEVKYNGEWGTICDDGWTTYDAIVICRMLNYTDSVCAVTYGTNVFGEGTGNVWITNLQCWHRATHIDQCYNSDPQLYSPCSHREDAALICQDPSLMPVPFNVTELNQTTSSIIVGWKASSIPPYIRSVDFKINLTDTDSSTLQTYIYHISVSASSREFSYNIRSLSINKTYEIVIRAEGQYQWCSYNSLIGRNSSVYTISTADSVPPATLPIRLDTLDTPYIGRLQVMHNGEWGNVCNDYFWTDDADVACRSLNYTDGAVCYATRPFPLSTDTIWLDDLDCTGADRFEDCAHRGWGVHDCGSSESIGLICNPGPSAVPNVTGLRVTAVAPTYITIQWEKVPNIQRYLIQYAKVGSTAYYNYAWSVNEWTLRGLGLGSNYSINISAGMEFRNFYGGSCYYQYLYGGYSDSVYAVTRESPPTVAITDFHVTMLNSTAVEVTWRPPSSTTVGVNGDIRGYKLFVDEVNGNQTVLDIMGEENRVAFVTDLEPLTTYFFSILMYTVGDGPMSVRLQVTMPEEGYIRLISKFGVYGSGVEIQRAYTYTRGFNVLCGSDVKDATFDWRFSNGSRIGIANPGFRGAHFLNGTAVLQIGTAFAYTRYVTLCDGGLYTCIATHPGGTTVHRNFSLTVGYSQPVLNPPRMIQKGSTWIQIGWDQLNCDGGYPLQNYFVEYRSGTYYYYSSYSFAGVATGLNFTVRNLSPNTEYDLRVARKTTVGSSTSYSRSISVRTSVAGPSPPLSVSVKVGYNSEVCATWGFSATPVGTVILYKLYAEQVEDSDEALDAVDLPTGTAVKTFPASERSGCMQMSVTGVIYHFQMSAVAVVNGESVEGTLSPFSAFTTIFVPEPGVPAPVDVEASATNASVTLQWGLPESVPLGDVSFKVFYSSVVEWTSATGVFTSFKEKGQRTTDATSLTILPLTPSTEYQFRLGLVTVEGKHGEEVSLTITTANETGDRLAYFQVRIKGIGDCSEWVSDDPEYKLSEIKKSLRQRPISLCQCQTTESQLSQAEFSCRTGPPDTAIFRARVLGTPSRSASDMTATIRDWVEAGSGSIKIGTSRFPLDPSCDPSLENIHAPDCEVEETDATTPIASNTPTTSETTEKTDDTTETVTDKEPSRPTESSEEDRGGDENGASSAQVVGILLGGLIAGLLTALFVTLAITIYLWFRNQKKQSFKEQSAFGELVDQPCSISSGFVGEDDKL